MFLKSRCVKKNGKTYKYWSLVESVRTSKGPRHKIVAALGELSESEQSGWARLASRISGRKPDWLPKLPFAGADAGEPVPTDVSVRLNGIEVRNTRDFADIFIALTLWKMLGLDELLERELPAGREQIPWALTAMILAAARFCQPSSELHVAESWFPSTALASVLGDEHLSFCKDRLYRAHDRILPLKSKIEEHLKERYTTLFDAKFDLFLYDVTSTYFEGMAEKNKQAKRGHSRDHRNDCKQVCIGLVVTSEGLPVAYEVFDGNMHDSKTVKTIVESMEVMHGRANRIWVMDRGMIDAGGENLAYIRERGGRYITGTPKASIKRFEKQLGDDEGWHQMANGVAVKVVRGSEVHEPDSDDAKDVFILCRSGDRASKEEAMFDRFADRIEEGLTSLKKRLDKAKKPTDRSQIERQIGRLLQRNSRAASSFDVNVSEVVRNGKTHHAVKWNRNTAQSEWRELSHGCYMLRSNVTDWDGERLWKSYIQLTQAEAAFKTQKNELSLRPIWHQQKDRVQAHILFSFLAYAMWKCLEQWMSHSNIGNSPQCLLNELRSIKLNDVILPTSDNREIRLQCVTKPNDSQQLLLNRLGLALPGRIGHPEWQQSDKV